ncbi:hypothetical protein ACH5RR_019065 [Cinchona calisaya]|uniref:Uncharacterized protein n=1 Tax=Cinchona calisaya TaxID=153742 RepID=A0ABD2ZPZ6_9GENT
MLPQPVVDRKTCYYRSQGRPPKQPQNNNNNTNVIIEIDPINSPMSDLAPPRTIFRKPRTKISTKPNKKYVTASNYQGQSVNLKSVEDEEIAGGEICPCCKPLSEIELPGDIPYKDDLDCIAWDGSLLQNFFKDVPDIRDWCKLCK